MTFCIQFLRRNGLSLSVHTKEYPLSSPIFPSDSTAGESSNNWTTINMSKSLKYTVASSSCVPFYLWSQVRCVLQIFELIPVPLESNRFLLSMCVGAPEPTFDTLCSLFPTAVWRELLFNGGLQDCVFHVFFQCKESILGLLLRRWERSRSDRSFLLIV